MEYTFNILVRQKEGEVYVHELNKSVHTFGLLLGSEPQILLSFRHCLLPAQPNRGSAGTTWHSRPGTSWSLSPSKPPGFWTTARNAVYIVLAVTFGLVSSLLPYAVLLSLK